MPAPIKAASYDAYLVVPLGRLISAMNRADARASFLSTMPANAFRNGVVEVVSQDWWANKLGHVEQEESARALRNRLQRDELAVGNAWRQQCEQSDRPLPCLQVFCETILGIAVYGAVVNLGGDERKTMRILGNVYGALLQSTAMTNHIVGKPVSTYQKYLLLHVEAIFRLLGRSRHFHMFEPADLARRFCSGVTITLPERNWDRLSLAASYEIRQRVEEDRARVAHAVPAEAPTPQDIFTALLGTTHAPGDFSYHTGELVSTPYELAHRQPAAARSTVFFPLSRRQSDQRW